MEKPACPFETGFVAYLASSAGLSAGLAASAGFVSAGLLLPSSQPAKPIKENVPRSRAAASLRFMEVILFLIPQRCEQISPHMGPIRAARPL